MKSRFNKAIIMILCLIMILPNSTYALSANHDLEKDQLNSTFSESIETSLETMNENNLETSIEKIDNENTYTEIISEETILEESTNESVNETSGLDLIIDETEKELETETVDSNNDAEEVEEIEAEANKVTDGTNSFQNVIRIKSDEDNLFYYYSYINDNEIREADPIKFHKDDLVSDNFSYIEKVLLEEQESFIFEAEDRSKVTVKVNGAWKVSTSEQVFKNTVTIPQGFSNSNVTLELKIPYTIYETEKSELSFVESQVSNSSTISLTLKGKNSNTISNYTIFVMDKDKSSIKAMDSSSYITEEATVVVPNLYNQRNPYKVVGFVFNTDGGRHYYVPQIKTFNVNTVKNDTTSNTIKHGSYSYQVNPILENLNDYLYLKTDNPNPSNIRLVDSSTIYKNKGNGISSFVHDNSAYLDVKYENISTKRVNGGYIFKNEK